MLGCFLLLALFGAIGGIWALGSSMDSRDRKKAEREAAAEKDYTLEEVRERGREARVRRYEAELRGKMLQNELIDEAADNIRMRHHQSQPQPQYPRTNWVPSQRGDQGYNRGYTQPRQQQPYQQDWRRQGYYR